MNVMHLLATAGTGGIESLCKDYSHYSNNNNIFVVMWEKNGVTANLIRQDGGVLIELDSKKKDVLKVFLKLNEIIKLYSIHVIVVHHASPIIHIYMQLLKRRYHNLKTIAYAHGVAEVMCRHNDPKGLIIRKKILELSLKKSTKVIAISNDVKESLVGYLGIPENHISVIYNGVDTSRFTTNIQENLNNPVRLVYVGRLIEEKGVQLTLEALSNLPKGLKWTFDVIGDGSYRKELEQQVNTLEVKNQIHFMGNCVNVPELLKEHDVFIHMPECEEGFGITIIEAMAVGLLCICREKGGILEIVTNGKDGILVHSKEELTEVLTDILSRSEKYEVLKLRENAVNRAKDFDIKQFSKHLDAFINEINDKKFKNNLNP